MQEPDHEMQMTADDELSLAYRSKPQAHLTEDRIDGQEVLKYMGDDLGAYTLLLCCLNHIGELEEALGSSLILTKIKEAVQCALRGVRHDFEDRADAVDSRLLKQELFLARYLMVKDKFTASFLFSSMDPILTRTSWTSSSQLDKFARNSLYCLQKQKSIHSDAEYLCEDLGSTSDVWLPATTNPAETIAAYRKAETDIRAVMQSIIFDQEACRKVFLCRQQDNLNEFGIRAFPALIIAFRRQDKRTAFKMLEDSPALIREVDIFERTLLHYAICSCDIHSLQKIAKLCPDAIRSGLPDIFGLSPLALAVLKNHPNMFEFLTQKGANFLPCDIWGRTLMETAARLDRRVIVNTMIMRNQWLASPPVSVLWHALDGRHEELAKIILPYCKDLGWYEPIGIEETASLATQKGFDNLAKQIRDLRPVADLDQQSLLCLEQVRVNRTAGHYSELPASTTIEGFITHPNHVLAIDPADMMFNFAPQSLQVAEPSSGTTDEPLSFGYSQNQVF
ncbi:hypothetical protein H2198_007642 [Neophaeococcomyces mojaviensis]|uniref:Uncharacterized protein n=1 Tax=Neophaeococcomyces mojaviensis TaxID=3383035 RepID=A0ACC2ZZH5_9EURO|nr:hypothetical protein H2198_007642 [Knufia sp. JES_112]